MKQNEAYDRLVAHGIKPSVQRIAIMQYLLTHFTHPTVDDVFRGLSHKIPTLSRTTVYNTLRLFSENDAARMITIDEHRICYDGVVSRHAHFYCKCCRRVTDVVDEAPRLTEVSNVGGNKVDDMQLYYKGICADCLKKHAAEEHCEA